MIVRMSICSRLRHRRTQACTNTHTFQHENVYKFTRTHIILTFVICSYSFNPIFCSLYHFLAHAHTSIHNISIVFMQYHRIEVCEKLNKIITMVENRKCGEKTAYKSYLFSRRQQRREKEIKPRHALKWQLKLTESEWERKNAIAKAQQCVEWTQEEEAVEQGCGGGISNIFQRKK